MVWVDVGRCSVEGRVAEAMEVVVYGLDGWPSVFEFC